MDLGAFSISLSVKDISASKEFYEKLGFIQFGGDIAQKWLIMKNGDHIIGLFEGMFDNNIITFNPGWDQDAHPLERFTDVRELQATFIKSGITPEIPVEDDSNEGPGSMVIVDPDGNQIMFDQHR